MAERMEPFNPDSMAAAMHAAIVLLLREEMARNPMFEEYCKLTVDATLGTTIDMTKDSPADREHLAQARRHFRDVLMAEATGLPPPPQVQRAWWRIWK